MVTAPKQGGAVATAGPWPAAASRGRAQLLVDCPEFMVRRWELRGDRIRFETPTFRVLTVIDGSGSVYRGDQSRALERGSSLVIPKGQVR